MDEAKKRKLLERDKIVDAAAERCVAHMRKKSNGDFFPYELIESLSGIKRYSSHRVYSKQWPLLVEKIKQAGRALPQTGLDDDDRGSFTIKTIIDEGFEVPPENKALVYVGNKWVTQTRGAAKRLQKAADAIQGHKLSEHANTVRIGMIDKADNIRAAAAVDAQFLAVMLKKTD